MPELPEVETIARALAPGLVGRVVTGAEVVDAKLLAAPKTARAFKEAITGRRIAAVRRRAKLLLLDLTARPDVAGDEPAILAMHLKMTGRFHIAPAASAAGTPPKYTRLLLPLSDGNALVFSDMRRFGTARLLSPAGLAAWDFYAALGPEPLDMTPEELKTALARRTTRIKAALLDQTVIAGIGNIYADEALFAAGIRPDTPASALSPGQREKLLAAIQAVIAKALAAGGSTIRDYRTPDGVEGGFQHHFTVYGRGGEPCSACGAKLSSVKIAGRTTTFCRCCQK